MRGDSVEAPQRLNTPKVPKISTARATTKDFPVPEEKHDPICDGSCLDRENTGGDEFKTRSCLMGTTMDEGRAKQWNGAESVRENSWGKERKEWRMRGDRPSLRDIPSDREPGRNVEVTWEDGAGGRETIKWRKNVCRGIEAEDKADRRRKT